ncbi:MAG: hypothetical protein AAGF72_07460 [Pseudomonadota bacterium]
MFRAIRIAVLLFILVFVGLSAWLTQARSTDWNNSLWVKIYPINADGSEISARHIERLRPEHFTSIEAFIAREAKRYGHTIEQPVRMELGEEIRQQPPALGESPRLLGVLAWSLKMRFWVSRVTDDDIDPDVRIFLRYHEPQYDVPLENSVGMQKGMYGIVNAFASRRSRGSNNLIVAHEFLHTLGATDKYDPATGQPLAPHGLAEPDRAPLYPQVRAEIMGGRIALSPRDAEIPASLELAIIGPETAREIGLLRD